jgi:ketosteroid isomerase-like protein
MKYFIYTAVLLLFSVYSQAQSTSKGQKNSKSMDQSKGMDDIKAQIDSANKAFSTALGKGDSAAMVELYHPEANIFVPNMEKLTDPKAMGSMTTHMPDMGITEAQLETKELFYGKETVTEVGTFQMGNNGKVVDKGKYIVVWKKDGNKWKMFRDIWNSDLAPMANNK